MRCSHDVRCNHRYPHEALLSVGSNIGDKIVNCRKGMDALTTAGNIKLIKQSRFYKTEPVDYTDQAWFVNGAFKIRTDLGPNELFEKIKGIERNAGRRSQSIRYGPRILDLDILLYDDRVIDTETLKIPHPRMHKRRFVLMPVCDIDPNINHPELNKSVGQLLEALDETSQEVILIP